MGVNDREQNKKDAKRERAAENRKRRNSTGGPGNTADWESADAELLRKAIASVARDGGAIRLGYTRDGGAYAVGIYGDGDPFTEYVPPSEDLDAYLRGVIEDYGK